MREVGTNVRGGGVGIELGGGEEVFVVLQGKLSSLKMM